jgi:hypothetical protein
MFYFANIPIDDSSLVNAEDAIRKYSLKRHIILDFQSSSSNIREYKYFLANENTNDLKITRIRTSFEWLFPKLIISVPKERKFDNFKVRYCLLSTIIFCYLVILISQSIVYSIIDNYLDENVFSILALLIVFLIFTSIEFRLTKGKINQAITNYSAAIEASNIK